MPKADDSAYNPPFREWIQNIRAELTKRDTISRDGILHNAPSMSALSAYALTVGLFFATGHATGVYNAIGYLGGWLHVAHDPPVLLTQGMIQQVGYISVALIAFTLALRVLHIRRNELIQPVVTKRSWKVFAAACTATLLGFGAAAMLAAGTSLSYPHADDHSWVYIISTIVDAFRAGITEEICLLALPVLFLRTAGRSWTEIIIALTVIRWSFHAYYGPASIGLMLWAAAVLILFRYTRSVIPIIAEHVVNDLKLPVLIFSDGLVTLMIVVLAGIAVYGIWAVGVSVDPSIRAKKPSKTAA